MNSKRCSSSNLQYLEKNMQDMLGRLINESDDLWKCLKYATDDALSQPITIQDKADLVDKNSNGYRFKLKRYNEDIADDERCEVRLSVQSWRGGGASTHEVSYLFEILCHNNIVQLADGRNRILTVQYEILKVLDGVRFDNMIGELTTERSSGISTSFNPKFQGIFFTLDTFAS